MSLLIECKRSTDKPWILFTSDKIGLANPARVAQRAANSLGRNYLHEVCQQEDIQRLSIFSLPERPAYGVTQAFTTGKDVCYSAVTSVSKAALATIAELDGRKEKMKFMRNICSILFPVVVVEGKLFEAFLDKDVDVVVKDIETGTLLWRNPVVGNPHTIINIVSESFFERFSDNILASFESLFELSENQLSEHLTKAIARENRPPARIS
jgi:hypothetical protein